LSAPFEESAERDDRATEVLPESRRTIRETEAMPAPAQPTIAAVFEPPPRQSPKILSPSESKPVALIGIIGLVTILCSLAIVILLLVTWQDVGSYFGWVLLRRIPLFLMALIAVALALIRINRHMRASLLVILALVIYFMEGMLFYLLNSAIFSAIAKMHISGSTAEWAYFFLYFCEDFVFAAVIILLVTAAFTGRKQFSNLTPETP
jgi:hypothetical protein